MTAKAVVDQRNSNNLTNNMNATDLTDLESAKIGKKSTGKRKFHKKSRNGCATCKRRRVKCDEGHPICGNCERMSIECIYHISDEIFNSQQDIKIDKIDKIENQNISMIGANNTKPKTTRNKAKTNHQISNPIPLMSQQQQQQQQQIPQISINSTSIPEIPPTTPLSNNANLNNMSPLSPISQFIQQQLPQSPAAVQILNSFPPDMQMKLFQQFQQLPVDKQQQLYQSLPMTMKSSSTTSELPKDDISSILNNLKTSTDSISDFIGELIPDRNTFKPIQTNGIPTPQELAAQIQQRKKTSKELPIPNEISNNNGPSLSPDSIRSSIPQMTNSQSIDPSNNLNMLDLRLMYHYTTKVWPTITAAGISDSKIWSDDIPMLAFQYPFLMHSVLAFSATHLSRTEKGLDQCVTCHRAEALRLLGDAVLEMSPENTDALVASALILIMDSLANASLPTSSSIKSLPPSAWIFHVKGAATILTAVWPLSEKSRFYKFISVDLGDLADIGYDLISGELANTSDSNENSRSNSISREKSTSPKSINKKNLLPNLIPNLNTLADVAIKNYGSLKKQKYSKIQCFDEEISDMFPIPLTSPYFPTLAYMAKLHNERYKSDFILRIFAFPALLDKRFLGLLINCDLSAMRIMRCYYKLLRNFTEEMKEKVWFLEGVSSVLPVDVEQYAGGGGMHMMLDFLGGPSIIDDDGNGENYVAKSAVQSGLLDTNNLPSASMNQSLGLDDNSGLNNDADIDD